MLIFCFKNFEAFLGGVFLILKNIISWRVPTTVIIATVLFALPFYLYNPDGYISPLQHLFTGGLLLGAFFIATDPVTASITPRGKLIFGSLVGLLVYLIRYYGNYPDAVAFSVLLANICVPLIDHYTQPRLYGTKLDKL